MKSRSQSQLNLGPMEVGNSERSAAPSDFRNGQTGSETIFRKSESESRAFRNSESEPLATPDGARALSAEIFRESLRTTKIGNVVGLEPKEVAALLNVSASLVEKWCRGESAPSDVQMLCMPWAFHLARHRVMNKRFGFWRAAIGRVFESFGDVVMGCE